jgi:response regulator RpfG family c-di-GMP phosphodiesterase
MNKKRIHKVLIVDDTKEISTPLGKVLKKNGIGSICSESIEAGLNELGKENALFSLIVSDQVEFLEHAKEASPSAIRILISDYSDNDILVESINKGIVQKFILKPFTVKELIEAVKQGFFSFKNTFENEQHVRLAEKKNKKLYQLDLNLKKRAATHKKKIETMDQIIAKMKTEIANRKEAVVGEKSISVDLLEESFASSGYLEKDRLDTLLGATLNELFGRFKDVAKENGLEGLTID